MSLTQTLLRFAIPLSIAYFVATGFRFLVFDFVKITGTSMAPVLIPGDIAFTQRHFYRLDKGDIVVFWIPPDKKSHHVREVIAVEGESVMINGLDVRVLPSSMAPKNQPADPFENPYHFTVPPESVFVLPKQSHVVLAEKPEGGTTAGVLPLNLIYGKVLSIAYSVSPTEGKLRKERFLLGLND